MFFDSHAHLDDSRFEEDRDQVILNACENDVSYILNPGADLHSSVSAAETAQKYDILYASVGVHPHEVKNIEEGIIEKLRTLTKQKKVVAIGEIGLDFYYDHSPRDLQRFWFRKQMELALELNLPVIVHDRDAHGEVFNILKEYDAGRTGCVMHCYSGSLELAKEYIKRKVFISLAGPVTFKNAEKVHAVAKEIPLEWLLIETDAPYMAPAPFRGKRNEPAYVKLIAEAIAKAKGITPEAVAKQTTFNAKKLFGIY